MIKWKDSKLIGKRVYIPNEEGKHYGDWGRVIGYDGEYYHIAFADDKSNVLIFKRSEFHICKYQ